MIRAQAGDERSRTESEAMVSSVGFHQPTWHLRSEPQRLLRIATTLLQKSRIVETREDQSDVFAHDDDVLLSTVSTHSASVSTIVLTKYLMDFAWFLNLSSVNVALLTNL